MKIEETRDALRGHENRQATLLGRAIGMKLRRQKCWRWTVEKKWRKETCMSLRFFYQSFVFFFIYTNLLSNRILNRQGSGKLLRVYSACSSLCRVVGHSLLREFTFRSFALNLIAWFFWKYKWRASNITGFKRRREWERRKERREEKQTITRHATMCWNRYPTDGKQHSKYQCSDTAPWPNSRVAFDEKLEGKQQQEKKQQKRRERRMWKSRTTWLVKSSALKPTNKNRCGQTKKIRTAPINRCMWPTPGIIQQFTNSSQEKLKRWTVFGGRVVVSQH